ncbi:MAG: hypothetical protein IJF48_04680 [Clostridia bacterium]|nr:hypothetical protein [Clostridia bacterium]
MKKLLPCRISMAVLKYGLAVVSAVLIYIAFTTASLDAYDAARLHVLFVEEMEHALMSLLLIIAGAVLLDIAISKR